MFNDLVEEKCKIETHQQLFDEFKHRLQMLIKDAEKVVFMEEVITWKRAQDSVNKALSKEHPEYL